MECDKIAFSSFREAQEVINTAHKHKYSKGKRINKKKAKIPQRSYKCEFCGYWHLTSSKNKFK